MQAVAIISDTPGNLPALQAVIADIEQQGIQERVCRFSLAVRSIV